MAELNNKKLPNLKICVDNTDNSEEEDAVAIADELTESSEGEEEIEEDSDNVEFNVRIANAKRKEESPVSSEGSSSDSDSEDGSAESDTEISELPVIPSVKSRLQPRVESPPKPKRKPSVKKIIPKIEINRRYENKAGEFVTGIDVLSKEAMEKRERRAQRFGLSQSSSHHGEPDITHLYASLDITEALESEDHEIRLESIHLQGTDKMSTEDIFKHFAEFPPAVIEWINDSSCNVVWGDVVTCARAMLKLSRSYDEVLEEQRQSKESAENSASDTKDDQPMAEEKPAGETTLDEEKVKDKEEAMETDDDDDLDLVDDTDKGQEVTQKPEPPLPERLESTESADPETGEQKKQAEGKSDDSSQHSMEAGGRSKRRSRHQQVPWPLGSWRLGQPHPKARFLFFRYATKADKKLPGSEKRSKYYRKYGNPNYGGMKGLVSRSMKRRMLAQAVGETLEEDEGEDEEEPERPVKRPRMASQEEELEEGEVLEEEPEKPDKAHKDDGEDEMDMDRELQQLIRPVPKARSMKMYADEEEALIKARRVASSMKVVAEPKAGIKSRLGRVPASSSSSDSIPDARQRIGRRGGSPDSYVDYDSPTVDLRSRLGSGYAESPLTAGRGSSDLRSKLKRPRDPQDDSQYPSMRIEVFD